MERKIMIMALGFVALATWLLLWRVLPFDLSREGSERDPHQESTEDKVARLDEVMKEANSLLEISQVVSGGPELVGGPKPLAVYTVTLVQEIPSGNIFF